MIENTVNAHAMHHTLCFFRNFIYMLFALFSANARKYWKIFQFCKNSACEANQICNKQTELPTFLVLLRKNKNMKSVNFQCTSTQHTSDVHKLWMCLLSFTVWPALRMGLSLEVEVCVEYVGVGMHIIWIFIDCFLPKTHFAKVRVNIAFDSWNSWLLAGSFHGANPVNVHRKCSIIFFISFLLQSTRRWKMERFVLHIWIDTMWAVCCLDQTRAISNGIHWVNCEWQKSYWITHQTAFVHIFHYRSLYQRSESKQTQRNKSLITPDNPNMEVTKSTNRNEVYPISKCLPSYLALPLSPRGAYLHLTLCTELSMRWSNGRDEFRWMCSVNIGANPITCTVVQSKFRGNGGSDGLVRDGDFRYSFDFWLKYVSRSVWATRRFSLFSSLFFCFWVNFDLISAFIGPLIQTNSTKNSSSELNFNNFVRPTHCDQEMLWLQVGCVNESAAAAVINYIIKWFCVASNTQRNSLHIVTVGCVAPAAHCCMSRRAVRCTHSFSAQIIANQFFVAEFGVHSQTSHQQQLEPNWTKEWNRAEKLVQKSTNQNCLNYFSFIRFVNICVRMCESNNKFHTH